MTKNIFIKLSFLALFLIGFESAQAGSPSSVWNLLEKGNNKFVKNRAFSKERAQFVNGQDPNYVVLSCSDSRVTPEFIFSQGIGDLFVSRIAGNSVDTNIIDTIEYAISHFTLDAIVVLGHTQCGAVTGALKHLKKNHGAIDHIEEGHLNAVLIPIEIAILESGIDIYGSNALDLATLANVSYAARQLMINSSIITEAVNSGSLCIIGAIYNLQTGVAQEQFSIP